MNVMVSLSEVLEVQDGPLDEAEIWGVLCQAVETLQDMFLQSGIEGNWHDLMQTLPVSPGSLLLCCNGRVFIGQPPHPGLPNKEFIPPEFAHSSKITEDEAERMFLYSLGKTLTSAAKHRLPKNEDLKISPELRQLLQNMCNEEPLLRSSLFHVLRTCTNSRARHRTGEIPTTHFVIKLYQQVLGSSEKLSSWTKEDTDDWSPSSNSRHSKEFMKKLESKSPLRSRHGRHTQKARGQTRPIGRDEMSDSGRYSYISANDHVTDRTMTFKSGSSNHDLSRSTADMRSRLVLEEPRPVIQSQPRVTSKQKEEGIYASQVPWQPIFHIHNKEGKWNDAVGSPASGQLEQAYDRLHRRRMRLDILKREVHLNDIDLEDAFSFSSDTGTPTMEPRYFHSYADVTGNVNAENDWFGEQHREGSLPLRDLRDLPALDNEYKKLQRKEQEIEKWRQQHQMHYFKPLTVDAGSQATLNSTESHPHSDKLPQDSSGRREEQHSDRHRRFSGTSSVPSEDHSGWTSGRFVSEFKPRSSTSSRVHGRESFNEDDTHMSPRTAHSHASQSRLKTKTPSKTSHQDTVVLRKHDSISSVESSLGSILDNNRSPASSPRNFASDIKSHHGGSSQVRTPVKMPRRKSSVPSSALSTHESEKLDNRKLSEDSERLKTPIKKPRRKHLLQSHDIHVGADEFTSNPSSGVDADMFKSVMPGQKLIGTSKTCKGDAEKDAGNAAADGKLGLPAIADSFFPETEPRFGRYVPVEMPEFEALIPPPGFQMEDDKGLIPPPGFHTEDNEGFFPPPGFQTVKKEGLIPPPVFQTSADDARSLPSFSHSAEKLNQETQTSIDKYAVEEKKNKYVDAGVATDDDHLSSVTEGQVPSLYRPIPTPDDDYILGRADVPVVHLDSVVKGSEGRKNDPIDPVAKFSDRKRMLTTDSDDSFEASSPGDKNAVPNVKPDKVHVTSRPDKMDTFTDSPVVNRVSRDVEPRTITQPDGKDSSVANQGSQDVKPFFITKPDAKEIFTDSPSNSLNYRDVEPYVVTQPDKMEIFTDSKVRSKRESFAKSQTKSQDPPSMEPYILTEPGKNDSYPDSNGVTHAPHDLEPYIVFKSDKREVFPDSPAKSRTSQDIEPYVVKTPDKKEIFVDSPRKSRKESFTNSDTDATDSRERNQMFYSLTKPDKTENFQTPSEEARVSQTFDPYVITQPNTTTIFADSHAIDTDSHTKNNMPISVDPYVLTKPDETSIFADSPATIQKTRDVEPYVVTKPSKKEIFADSHADSKLSDDVEPYVVTKPRQNEIFTDSLPDSKLSRDVEPYIVTKPKKNEIFTDSPTESQFLHDDKHYVVTRPSKRETFTDSPADSQLSHDDKPHVISDPSKNDSFADSPVESRLSHDDKPHVIAGPSKTDSFADSPAEAQLSHVVEPDADEEDVSPDSPTRSQSPQQIFNNNLDETDLIKTETSTNKPGIQDAIPVLLTQTDNADVYRASSPDAVSIQSYKIARKPSDEFERKLGTTNVDDPKPTDQPTVSDRPRNVLRDDAVAVSESGPVPPPKAPRKLIRAAANDVPPTPRLKNASEADSKFEYGRRGSARDASVRTADGGARNDDLEKSSRFDDKSTLPNSAEDEANVSGNPEEASRKKDAIPRADSPVLGTKEQPRVIAKPAADKDEQGNSREIEAQEPAAAKPSTKPQHIASNKGPRQCYGPEFVNFNNQLATLIVPEAGGARESDLRHVIVVLLDGVHLDLICTANSTGRHLYDCVASYLTISETILFGLVHLQEGEYFFLNPDTKIHKVAPVDWKKKSKTGQRMSESFVLYFHVKFYISDLDLLRHQLTRHLFYLQLRHDLLDKSLHCSNEVAVLLGGLAMQAEYGDWYERSVDANVDLYLPPETIDRLGRDDAKEALVQRHLRYRGMQDEKAEWLFMQKCSQLQEYGFHFHKIFRTANTEQLETLWVGVGVRGVVLGEDQRIGRVFLKQHPWHSIYKISFNRHRFSIATKTSAAGASATLIKFNYYTKTYKKGQYLVWLSTEHHKFKLLSRFSRNMRSNSTPSSILEDEYMMVDGASSVIGSGGSLQHLEEELDNNRNSSNNNALKSEQTSPNNDQVLRRQRSRSYAGIPGPTVESLPQRKSLQFDSPGVLRTQDDEFDDDGDDAANLAEFDQLSNASSDLELEHVVPKELLKLPQSNRDVKLSRADPANSHEGDSEEVDRTGDRLLENSRAYLLPPRDNRNKFVDIPATADRYSVILHKQNNSFGLNIAGGASTNVRNDGVYVRSLTPGGAADQDGRIQIGDRVLEVNGISLVGASHREAVEILRSSPQTSSLLLERHDPPSATPSISPWSSMARSEPEVETTDTGVEVKAESNRSGKNNANKRHISNSESGIHSELSAYTGDMRVRDQQHLENRSNRSGLPLSAPVPGHISDTTASLPSVEKSEEVRARHKAAAFEVRKGFGESEADQNRKELERFETAMAPRKNIKSSLSHPASTASSMQFPLSEFDGDIDSSVFAHSVGQTSRQAPFSSDGPKSEYEDLSLGRSVMDEDDRQELMMTGPFGRKPGSSKAEGDEPLGSSENLTEGKLNRLAILKNIPEHLTSEWLETLPLISCSANSQIYTPTNLELMIEELTDRLDREEPAIEYKSLRQVKLTDFCLVGLNSNVRHKNRYRNIIPYDKNRVKISGPDDYINASHITFDVGEVKCCYIAAQGPLPGTNADFWQMVWEQSVDVIAMLTQEVESGKVKCDRYWPELDDGPVFVRNMLRITQLEFHLLPNCIVRIFQLDNVHRHTSRLVTHLNFTAWPDHYTPQNTASFLRFIRLLHHVRQDASHPILVHCSAGVGRTGAFLAIDICIALIEHDLQFNIEAVARDLRQKRHEMIQTQGQYRFCYTTILSALQFLHQTLIHQKKR